MPVYDDLKSIGYQQNDKSRSSMKEFSHAADMDDEDHRSKFGEVMSQHGYQPHASTHLPTWVNQHNDDDAFYMLNQVKGSGHRLFHDKGDTAMEEDTIDEGFQISVQHTPTASPIIRLAAKTHQQLQTTFEKLRNQYPRHHITITNKHTGLSQLYRPKKIAVQEETVNKKTLKEMFDGYLIEYTNWDRMSKEAKELVLHADNNRDLRRHSTAPIMNNLSSKMSKGSYDHEKAKKLWAYHADRSAQSFTKSFGSNQPWHKQFSTATRREAAKFWADRHLDQMKSQS